MEPEGAAPAPTAAENGGEPQQQQEEKAAEPAPPNPLIAVVEEQWKKVHEATNDSADKFTAWTALITTAEKLDDLERLRAVYEAFLPVYPLCFGYWRKYAEAENRHGNVERALEVYVRGAEATPYSMDLWRDYAAFKKTNGGTVEDLRQIYDRALSFNASDYTGHQLWDKLVALEEEMGDPQHVVQVYARALKHPLRELPRYSSSLKQYVSTKPLSELLSAEEVTHWTDLVKKQKVDAAEAARQAVEAAKQEAAKAREAATLPPPEGLDEEAAAAAAAAAAGAAAEADAAVVAAEAAAEAAAADSSAEEEEIKASWLYSFSPSYESSRQLAESRRPYEEGVKRTWWHIKPLDQAQLTNWARYLDHLEREDEAAGRKGADLDATQTIYERCLVPCANYPEFWERYVHWLEAQGRAQASDQAVARATTIFCAQRPEAWLLAARHAERRGQAGEARAHYTKVLGQLAPGLMSAVAAFANFERRQGDLAAARALWEAALSQEKDKHEQLHATEAAGEGAAEGKDKPVAAKTASAANTKQFAFLSMQYATFLKEVCGDADKAREVLREALGAAPQVRNLWEAAIHLELSVGGPGTWGRVAPLFECACAQPPAPSATTATTTTTTPPRASEEEPRGLPEKDREELSARSVEVADAYGTLQEALAAEAAHTRRFPVPASFGGSSSAATAGSGEGGSGAATHSTYGAVGARKRVAEGAAAATGADYYGGQHYGGAGGYGQGAYKAARGPEVGASPHAAAAAYSGHHAYAPQPAYGGYGAAGGYGQGGYGGYGGQYGGQYGGYY